MMTISGVGIGTSRYGHVASFVREDRNRACAPVEFLENRDGYEQRTHQVTSLAAKRPTAQLIVRIDAAGEYALNLDAYLPEPAATAGSIHL